MNGENRPIDGRGCVHNNPKQWGFKHFLTFESQSWPSSAISPAHSNGLRAQDNRNKHMLSYWQRAKWTCHKTDTEKERKNVLYHIQLSAPCWDETSLTTGDSEGWRLTQGPRSNFREMHHNQNQISNRIYTSSYSKRVDGELYLNVQPIGLRGTNKITLQTHISKALLNC